MSAVSLTAVGQLKGQTAPYSLASITGTVYDSSGATFTIPATKSLVFFRSKTFTSPLPPENQGIVTTIAGDGNGFLTPTSLYYPYGLTAYLDDNVLVCDYNCIRYINSSATLSIFAGNETTEGFSDGIGTQSYLARPQGVTFDAATNTVYVADTNNHRIRKLIPTWPTWWLTTIAGRSEGGFADGTGTNAVFFKPSCVAVRGSDLIVADAGYYGGKIRKVTLEGVVTTLAGSGSVGFADGTGAQASFNDVKGIAVDAQGNVYLADTFNHRIRKMTFPNGLIPNGGVVTTFAGDGYMADGFGQGRYANGVGTAASFNRPTGIAIDLYGNLYIADWGNHRIRKVTPGGVVTTFAGDGYESNIFGEGRWLDGVGTAASFNRPYAIAINSRGNLFVNDSMNFRIRKIV